MQQELQKMIEKVEHARKYPYLKQMFQTQIKAWRSLHRTGNQSP